MSGRGRPRDPRVEEALCEAALALLVEGGLRAVTMVSVAARAGMPRSTLLRRFKTPEEVIVEACRRALQEANPASTLEVEPRVQVESMLRGVARLLGEPGFAAAVRVVAGEMGHNEAMREALRQPLEDRRALLLRALRPVVEDVESAADALLGGLYLRFLFYGEVLDGAQITALVQCVLKAG